MKNKVHNTQGLMGKSLSRIGLLAMVFMFSVTLNAEVITDGTVGSALGLTGPHYLVEQSLGRTVGSNLFHSFQSFNLSHSESATFTGSDSIQNVISRVTGGGLSSIDGTLNSDIGQANFYFINPAGVVLGPNAQVNVPGDFHVSTASELRFRDGTIFDALHPESSTLSMARPESFGFLNDHSAAIRIEGSQLEFVPNSSVSFTGDVIDISNGSIIKNPNGKIHFSAQDVFQMHDSRITATGNQLGFIAIDAGKADIVSSQIFASTGGDQTVIDDTGITIKTKSLYLNNTEIHSVTQGMGDAGSIFLSAADSIQVTGNKIFSIAGQGSNGNAGSITLIAGESVYISKGGSLSSSTHSSGMGGDVFIQADRLMIDGKEGDATGIHNIANNSGDLGSITIDVEHDIVLVNHAQIISKPDAGGTGGGGIIDIDAENLRMQNQSLISTESINQSAANNINITTEESLYLDHSMISASATLADAGNISLASDVLVMNGGVIQANTSGPHAQAGNIDINAETIIANQGQLTVSTGSIQYLLQGGDLNVIQSAASDGVKGNLNLSTAELNISGLWMIEPKMEWLNVHSLIETPCLNPNIRNSKLSRKGSGGMPELPSDVRSAPLNRERLRRILMGVSLNNSDTATNQRKTKQITNSLKLLENCG